MDELENMIGPHEHNFAEEQEESGRLMLGPCLSCGMAAADAMVKAEEEISDLSKEIAELKARVADYDSGMAQNNIVKHLANDVLRLTQSNDAMREALKGLLEHYVALVNSGDAGNWNPETEKPVVDASAAIQKEEK